MDAITTISNRLINQVKTNFKRSLLHEIDWKQNLIEIRGSRGVGKTTMLLQKAKSLQEEGQKVIYMSLELQIF